MSLPKELEEAASIDGCGALSTFVRIVLPNTKPVIATATVLTVVSQWSDFMWPLIAVTSAQHKTVQVAIQGRYGPIMAALVFTIIRRSSNMDMLLFLCGYFTVFVSLLIYHFRNF